MHSGGWRRKRRFSSFDSNRGEIKRETKGHLLCFIAAPITFIGIASQTTSNDAIIYAFYRGDEYANDPFN